MKPKAEVSGLVIKALLLNATDIQKQFLMGMFKNKIEREQYSLEFIDPKDPIKNPTTEEERQIGWYNMEHWVSLLNVLLPSTLNTLGQKVAITAQRNNDSSDFLTMMKSLDSNYKANYRGDKAYIGDFKMIEQESSFKERRIIIYSSRPMPTEYDLGILKGFARLLLPKNFGHNAQLILLEGNVKKYLVSWT